VASLATELHKANQIHKSPELTAGTAAFSASYLAANTVSSFSTLQTLGFNPGAYDPKSVPAPDFRDRKDLGQRLRKLDPSLGDVCEQIFQSLYGNTADPARSALFMARQTWDHLSESWLQMKRCELRNIGIRQTRNKSDLVTRTQRIEYAAHTHVKDEGKRTLLLATSKSMRTCTMSSNLPTIEPALDRSKAARDLTTIYAWLAQWADALDI